MYSSFRSFLTNLATLVVIVAGFFFILNRPPTIAVAPPQESVQQTATSSQTAAVVVAATTTKPVVRATTTKAVVKKVSTIPQKQPVAQKPANQVERIEHPYPFAPLPASDVNTAARLALVNILCTPRGGSLSPISGSGVIIDPRGVILTNAHVAQYVLLSQDARVDLSCIVRMGAPAVARFIPEVLYIPPVWVEAHASEIRLPHPTGTGEHDYALLAVTATIDHSPLPASFPSLPFDTREGVGFQGDQVLIASYPAEFIGGIVAQLNLFPASSVSTIGQLITFGTNSVDVLSLGGVIEAQSGSSGGAVVNAWGRLIGLISTTSEGATTAERDLHALTLSYINRDLMAQSQFDLATVLGGDILAEVQDLQTNIAPKLVQLYLDQLSKGR